MNINKISNKSKSSDALGKECEATKKNMAKLCKEAGFPDAKKVKVGIPMIPGSKDDVQFVCINGVKFYFMRGEMHDVPEPVYNVMKDCGVLF